MKLRTTNLITDAVNAYLKRNPKKKWATEFDDEWINHRFLIHIARELPGTTLEELVKGTSVYIPPSPPAPPKTEEFMALMDRLRSEAKEREYQQLISSSSQEYSSLPTLSTSEAKEVKEQVTTIFNIMISIIAVTLAMWFWTKSWQLPMRTLMSLMAALITALAETVVYLGYKERVAEARAKERTKREKKRVVRVLVGGESDSDQVLESNMVSPVADNSKLRQRK